MTGITARVIIYSLHIQLNNLVITLYSLLCTADHSGADWESSLQRQVLHSPTVNGFGIPQGSTCGPRQGQQLSSGAKRGQLRRSQNHEAEDDEEDGETAVTL